LAGVGASSIHKARWSGIPIPAIPLEFRAEPADNLAMATAVKKSAPKQRKPFRKRPVRLRRPAMAKPAEQFDPVADAAECRKISQTLDVDAFDSIHKKNTAAQQYWESTE